jgi:hypothetical protein
MKQNPSVDPFSLVNNNNYYQERVTKRPIVRELTEEKFNEELTQSYMPRTRTMEIPYRQAQTITSPMNIVESVRQPAQRYTQDYYVDRPYERKLTAPLLRQSQVSQITEYPAVEERFYTVNRAIKPIPLDAFDKKLLNVYRAPNRQYDEHEVIGMPPAQLVGVPGCKLCGGYGFIKFKKNMDRKLSCLSCYNDTGYCPRCDNTGMVLNNPKYKCNCGNRK